MTTLSCMKLGLGLTNYDNEAPVRFYDVTFIVTMTSQPGADPGVHSKSGARVQDEGRTVFLA